MNESFNINNCSIGRDINFCFDHLSDEELGYLEKNTVEVRYSSGETICKQGSFASHIMLITEGLAKIYISSGKDKLILKILPAVNMIGLSSLIQGNNVFQYSARAYVETNAKLIEINAFKEILNGNGKFASDVLSLLAENLLITYGRFFCLTKKQSYGRLADILLCLAQRVYKKDRFPLLLTRKDLAELSDISIESTTRILTKFKEDKLIKMENDSIEILDVERLSLISQNG